MCAQNKEQVQCRCTDFFNSKTEQMSPNRHKGKSNNYKSTFKNWILKSGNDQDDSVRTGEFEDVQGRNLDIILQISCVYKKKKKIKDKTLFA